MGIGKEEERGGRVLLVFGSFACSRIHLLSGTTGSKRVVLAAKEMGIEEDVIIRLEWNETFCQLEEKELRENSPFYYYTKTGEELLILLSKEMNSLLTDGRILPGQREKILIGSGYKNQIFYECFSLVREVHAEILYMDGEFTVSRPEVEGVYVNGRILNRQVRLKSGDCVEVYGLHILVLKGMLVCVSFCGTCRTAMGRDRLENKGRLTEKYFKEGNAGKWIERRCAGEEELHTGGVEITLPEKPERRQRESLFLSLGPTLTMVLPVLLMAQLGSRFMEGTGRSFYYMSVIMSGSSALLALFWGMVNHGYRERMRKRENREREHQYMEYLEGIESYLSGCMEENRVILEKRYPPFWVFLGEENGAAVLSWNRYYRQKDFLCLRIGKGDIPFQIKVKLSGTQKNIVQGKLTERAWELMQKYKYMDKAPVEVDLYENRQIGITGEEREKVLIQLLMQIMNCLCYTEVKTVCFYDEEKMTDGEIAGCLKWMPHSWSGDRKVRFLAGNEKEAARILPVLTKELKREQEQTKNERRIPWYIVVVLHEELIAGEPLYRYLTQPGGKYPVSAVFLGEKRENLPKSCRYFIRKEGAEGEILSLGSEQVVRKKITLETCSSIAAGEYVRKVTGIRVRETEIDGQMPQQVRFLQMYDCGRVEELQSERRWQLARCEERLKVPIGCRAGGCKVSLDVHEKFHGPHGLIAGTTGSGKSELLQTYLLSVAVSFSPLDVNFFMIDYKGGGTGNALMGLPHCAGVISNLSGSQIKRAMSAITSENKRRQRLLSRFQVNHIDAYTKLWREGKGDEPMPHLILVVDEFAELKKEEPEFMQEIISLAQVGRSLGVHLILATQKPAGTVDDKIWSNARFRLCLRVQDKQDSMDMLHNGDAALLTSPGQCYLQIGNHEYYELFQTGYCGGRYVEEKEAKTRAALIENTGQRLEIPGKEAKAAADNRQSQMDILAGYINYTAAKMGYGKAKALWLPELPEKVFIEDLIGKFGGSFQTDEKNGQENAGSGAAGVSLILGLYDDPGNQLQQILTYEPYVQGNLAVCGGPSTGKTTLLKTILWQLATFYRPQESLFMVADMGQESLSCFLAMPNCLAALKKKEDRDIFFHHLERLFMERQKLLSGVNVLQYNKSEKGKLAQIFLVIDNFGSFYKVLEEKQEEFFLKLVSQGLSLGFYLVLSAAGAGEIGGRIFEKMKTTLSFEMSDRFQYGDILRQYYLPVLPKANQKGRGLCRVKENVLEFQAALAGAEQDYGYAETVKEAGRKREEFLKRQGRCLPEKFPVIPEKAEYGKMADDFCWNKGEIPLGYCLSSGEICGISMENTACFLISGEERTGRRTLLRCLIEGALCRQNEVVVLDTGRRFQNLHKRERLTILTGEEEMEKWQMDFSEEGHEKDNDSSVLEAGLQIKDRQERPVSVFISDMGSFCRFLYSSGQRREERITFWERAAMGKGKIAFLTGIYHPAKDYEAAGTGFFGKFTSWQQGICLGGNVAAQRALSFDDLSYAKQNQKEPAGIGYYKEGVGKEILRVRAPVFTED
ncbi:type VII secretion protein EssC [Parablautia intestinalis]|uniref:Type VII secretion protein EssC n=1 Tax=Parablautia intestinalis TaxID=2320100 RepID=A0A3A9AIR3_9FIRM|nr:type VII secretion protein EssC [Parablautia intestinalis]RKI91277.1 type VII secretion protein EssC [Parablautia intestinalis]